MANPEHVNVMLAGTDAVHLWLEKNEGQSLDLLGADLRDVHLERANLQGFRLRNVNLKESHLQGADLRGADLHGAVLILADLRRTNLAGANLKWANLWKTDLRGARIWGATLEGDERAHLSFPQRFSLWLSRRVLHSRSRTP